MPSQVAVEFAGGKQVVHRAVPQLVRAAFETQAPLHRWKPGLQANPQAVPLHVGAALAGDEQGVHDMVPQLLVLPFDWQIPEQSCDPDGHTPMHEALSAMQAPAHSLVPDGQVAPHDVPSQVAVPPIMSGQAVQDVPQLAVLVFARQAPPHA